MVQGVRVCCMGVAWGLHGGWRGAALLQAEQVGAAEVELLARARREG